MSTLTDTGLSEILELPEFDGSYRPGADGFTSKSAISVLADL
jgi:hypothetical protein